MRTVKKVAVAGLAAAAIGFGGLAAAPSASAMPMTCAQAISMAHHYMALGDISLNVFGNPVQASYYYGKGSGLLAAAC